MNDMKYTLYTEDALRPLDIIFILALSYTTITIYCRTLLLTFLQLRSSHLILSMLPIQIFLTEARTLHIVSIQKCIKQNCRDLSVRRG